MTDQMSRVDVRPVGETARVTDPAASADDAFDYGDDALPDEKAVTQAFEDLDQLARRAERATDARKKAEEQLERCKKAEEQLLTKDIPDLMERMRMGDFTTSSGIEIKVKRDIKLSLPGHERIDARMGALKWLVDRGHGGVIKNSVSVTLDRGEDDRANDLVVELRGKGFAVESKKDVHASTLSALGREMVADGQLIPRDLFNYFDVKIAKLSRKD